MDDLNEQLSAMERKVGIVEDFIALSLRRSDVAGDVQYLLLEASKVAKLMTEAHQLMQDELTHLQEEYETVMRRMRRQSVAMLEHVAKERRRKAQEAQEEEKEIQSLLVCSSAVKCPTNPTSQLLANIAKMTLNPNSNILTPKIKISDYKESPLVKRKLNPLSITFQEFDVQITPQQFETIPKYMCGRETLDQLNGFLESVIIPCFNEKYQLLHRQRSTVRNPTDLELWKLYNEQASYLPGRHFITPGDISRKINRMLDKKLQNRIVMLRHIGILQELRVSHTVCYVWTANSGLQIR